MTLSGSFATAAGSVTGHDHRRAERDGQDGHATVASDDVVAAIVTDGCSSGRSSEIGARLGARWLAMLVEQHFASVTDEAAARTAAAGVSRALVRRLGVLARSLDASGVVRPACVDAVLLFGYLAAVVTVRVAMVFGIGDGIVVVDGAVTSIDPGPDNAPPYAAYGLLGPAPATRVHFVGPSEAISVLAVATDGLAPLASLGALTSDPRYARNPSLLRKRLIVLASEGTFADDATVGLVQRRPR